MFSIPSPVTKVIDAIYKNGYECYLVGGCLRDLIMGNTPSDYDIATNALPNNIKNIFSDFKTIDIGIKHGTVAVIVDNMQIEITTYRIDGQYIDLRRPSCVTFSSNINDDLSRRDFTMNAVAYNSYSGILDPFNGINDINHSIIRSVGEPQVRFNEDALRIMRAVRFSSQLGFDIEPQTKTAIHNLKNLLDNISRERISSELNKILLGKYSFNALTEFSDLISQIIPESKLSIGFNQHTKYHIYDVWTHSAKAVSSATPKTVVKITMLLHDIGKPFCFKMDNNGCGHFYGHAAISAEIAKKTLRTLKYDNKTIHSVVELIKHHSDKIESKKTIKHLLNVLGTDLFFDLLNVKRSDISAKADFCTPELDIINQIESDAKKIISNNECFKIADLKINGYDLINMDVKGKQIGEILQIILDNVIAEKIQNNKNELIKYAENYIKQHEINPNR